MKTVSFVKHGEAISDFEVESKVRGFITSDLNIWDVSNSLVLDFFRVAIKEKTINSDDYEFFVEDFAGNVTYFHIDKDGRSRDWVDSQDVWTNLVSKLL